jgi:hypothetical protein
MSTCLRLLLGSALLLAIASQGSALTFTIDASDSGFHDDAGNHVDTTNENYTAGWADEALRNWFVFDVSGLPAGETVLSVTLRLYSPAVGEPDVTYTGGYDSPDATETYEVHELLLPSAIVTAPSVLNPAVYTAIGTGALFGSHTASATDNGQLIDMALNAAGIAAVDAAVAEIVLGGLVSSLSSVNGVEEFVFGHTDPLDALPGSPYTRQLIVVMTPEPGTGALVGLGLIGVASARRRRFRSGVKSVLGVGAVLALIAATAPGAASAVTEIKVLSNRADLISGGDALLEVVPVPPPGTVVHVGASNVTGSFALRGNGRYMGIVTGLAAGNNVVTVTLPDSSGASIAIDNHPIEGPVFTGPHLQPWDCTASGFDLPPDANCNVPPLVEYLYAATPGGSYAAYDLDNPPATVATTTNDQGETVRDIVRRESGAINRGLYAFAVLHDPALGEIAPWDPQQGFNGKLYYPFGASCNTNQTQGSSKTSTVMDATRLRQGYAVATTSLNELGHHCNPVISAETAMMTKERMIETFGPIRFTLSTGGSGGAIGQLAVSEAYPGITNGLMPSQMFADVWTTAIEVADCFLTETYWPKAAVPFTIVQKSAIDGHGPSQSSCAAWVALFVPSGIPSHGCFSGSTLPTTSTPDPERDYVPIANPEGCRATVNDLQVNIWGRRGQDGFAKRPIDNVGVQYGLEALNRPITDPAKITMAQFLDMNLKIGGVDIDGTPTTARTRTDPGVSAIAYRTGQINDGRGLARAAILNLAAPLNVEIHTPYHAYALEARMAAIGHQDNHAIWDNAPGGTAFTTMDAWLTAVEAAGGIDPLTGMDPATVKANKPATAFDSCWRTGSQTALPGTCGAEVFGDSRLNAGMSAGHDTLECQLEPISAADYPGAGPLGPTPADLAGLALIFPQGVCDYTKPPKNKVPSVQWLTYKDGPGGQPLGPVPTSTPF